MVNTAQAGQLAGECNLWIDTLRSFRNKFQTYKTDLQQTAGSETQQDVLQEIDHLDNQFHIQLINIHDLKHMVKKHMQRIGYGGFANNRNISDDVLARHEYLYDEYQRLETTLHIISREFQRFLRYVGVK